MTKLSLKLHGQIVKSLELDPDIEYFAGRSDDCAFPLGDHRGLSRQHLKFFCQDGVWYCESLSKFLHPKIGSENFETLEINASTSFTLFPYEFELLIAQPETPVSDPPISNNDHEIGVERALVPSQPSNQNFHSEPDTGQINMEATSVGSIQVTPILRILYPNSSENETLRLEGQVWTAGREADAEIQLHDSKISRKHFEINRNQEGYFVTDLGSSNGTHLNGQKLPPHEPTRLTSGDVLKALQIEIHFEIKASQLPAITAQPMVPVFSGPNSNQWLAPIPWGGNELEPTRLSGNFEGEPLPEVPANLLKRFDWKKNKVRVALVAVLLVGLVFFFMEPDKKGETAGNTTGNPNASANFDKLAPEQRAAVKDSLSLARNLYVQGKYSLCLAEIARLHEVVPFYDNSKELESFCIQGHELTQRKIDNDRKEAEKAMVEQKILDVTATCREKFYDQGEADEIRACLAAAIELNPEHPIVVELQQRAQDRVKQKQLMVEQKEEDARRRSSILSILARAKELKRKGKLAKAKSEYTKFISSAQGSLSTQKAEAQRELASVTTALAAKVNLLMEKCKALGESGKLKDAHKACSEALQEDPGVASATELQEKYLSALRRQMKVIYEDARLEESLGNVDTAKEKWKKIREEDLEFDDYYKNATIKLRQYGAL